MQPFGAPAVIFRSPPTCAAEGDTWKDRIGLKDEAARAALVPVVRVQQ